jgi:thioredoxin 1|tara:strand:+ start:817 stop:1068 length:252 start_codon:yes stop_codon:yes gene_type:complete
MNKLIYISATWCGPCRTFSPIMSKVAESGVPVQKMDADEDKEAVIKYGVRNIPTVLKVDAEGNMISKFVGVKTAQQVIDFYNG